MIFYLVNIYLRNEQILSIYTQKRTPLLSGVRCAVND